MSHRAIALISCVVLSLQACNQGSKGPVVSERSNPWFAAARSNSPETIREAAESGADPNAHTSWDYNTPLHIAAIDGNMRAVNALLAAKASPNEIDEDGRTPLLMACHRVNTQAVVAILKAGADPDIMDRQGQTAVMFAVNRGDLEAVKALIASGADVNAQRADKWTPLHFASREGYLDIARALLSAGADPTVVDRRGRTAIDIAKRKDNKAVLAVLTYQN
jgi:ankyrin repeat protein